MCLSSWWRLGLVIVSLAIGAAAATSSVCAQSAPAEQEGAAGEAAGASAGAALSGDDEARLRFEFGRRYYAAGRFLDAAGEFESAYETSRRPELLYNLFRTYSDAGDDARAARSLRAYLAAPIEIEDRVSLEARLRALEARLEAEPSRAPTGEPDEGGSAPPPAGGEGGGGLGVAAGLTLGVGGVLVLASVVTGVLALDDRASLDGMCDASRACAPGFEEARSRGQALAVATDALWVSGVVALGVGAALLVVELTQTGSAASRAHLDGVRIGAVQLDLGCTGEGCLARIAGRY